MNNLSKSVFALAVVAAQIPAFAHDAKKVPTPPKSIERCTDGIGVKLPFDPMFCDLNDDGKIDSSEVTQDNLCFIPGTTQDLFSQKPISALGLRKGQLLLTIDDGPNPNVTPNILNLLDSYGIKASFFVVGKLVASNQGIIREIVKRGHTLANHSYTHDVPNITPSTIVGEVNKTYAAINSVLGQRQSGRLLFRAPGLNWNAPKALNLNADATARNYIGPIHANLGTDAPRADWACWSQGASAATCANYYYEDILAAGRGIILMHDIYFKVGRPNSYEMLKILLNRLHTQGGGIANRSGSGVWEFVDIQGLSALDQFETNPAPTPTPAPVKRTSDGYLLIERFARTDVFVRTEALATEGKVTNASLINVGTRSLKTSDLTAVADLDSSITIGSSTFKLVRIESTRAGLESLRGKIVYVWTAAF